MPVSGRSPKEEIDKAIAVPKVLTSPDGRTFQVRKWEAIVCLGEPVVVRMECSVEVDHRVVSSKRRKPPATCELIPRSDRPQSIKELFVRIKQAFR